MPPGYAVPFRDSRDTLYVARRWDQDSKAAATMAPLTTDWAAEFQATLVNRLSMAEMTSAPDGHGMILIERCVVARRHDISCYLVGMLLKSSGSER
jgi:hypothetical protein